MFLLYGRHYSARYAAVADLIECEASIVDLCCGPAILYERYLRPKHVSYTGLDINEKFIRRLNRMGSRGLVWDLRQDKALPQADYAVMQASLYHFLPEPQHITDRMLKAARKAVIIAEPIRNLSSAKIPIVSSIGKRLTDPGTGNNEMRFTEQTLDKFFARYSSQLLKTFTVPGGREKVYVLAPGS